LAGKLEDNKTMGLMLLNWENSSRNFLSFIPKYIWQIYLRFILNLICMSSL